MSIGVSVSDKRLIPSLNEFSMMAERGILFQGGHYFQNVNSATEKEFLIVTHATNTTWVNVLLMSLYLGIATVYEAVTTSDDGTAVDLLNLNRQANTLAESTRFYHTPTVSDYGTTYSQQGLYSRMNLFLEIKIVLLNLKLI